MQRLEYTAFSKIAMKLLSYKRFSWATCTALSVPLNVNALLISAHPFHALLVSQTLLISSSSSTSMWTLFCLAWATENEGHKRVEIYGHKRANCAGTGEAAP